MPLEFANVFGTPMPSVAALAGAKPPTVKRPPSDDDFHKGFSVFGVPAGALEEAQAGHQRVVAMAQKAGGAAVEPFDANAWLNKAKLKKVRSKPYELQQAAEECARLATQAGWKRVCILEVKRQKSAEH